MTPFRFRFLSVVVLVLGCLAVPIRAQQESGHSHHSLDRVHIGTVKVAEGIYMLTGEGGNIGVSAGDDGVFLVDDQFAPLTEDIQKAVAVLSPKPIKFVLNTHWHADHTGGNENLGEAGALIVAHDNVRVRMSVEQFQEAFDRRTPPSAKAALPVVTFNDTVTFHLNGDEIHVLYVPPAHTDGDSVIHFRNSNVIHTGDLFTNARYPFIDVSTGGSIDGMIAGSDRLLAMTDSETKLMPGHGPVGDRVALEEYRQMLVTVRDRVGRMVDAGKTLEEVVQAKPTKEFDQKWKDGFLTPDDFVRIVYRSLELNGS